jgi:DNA-binding beta-propeller fold protein YncE
MDFTPPNSSEPFIHEESRVERRGRRARARRRIALGSLIAVIVLAGAGYGVYRLMANEGSETTETTISGASTVPADDGAATGATSTSTSSAAVTSTTLANLAPQTLTIAGNPEFVNLAIALQDGTMVVGKTPFSQEVPGGHIEIEFSKADYNSTTRKLLLDEPSTFKVWLDPEGQLLQSVVRFKCGTNPQQVAFTPDGTELWTSLRSGAGLEVYDPSTGAKLDEVKLGEYGAVELIFTKDGKTVYASQTESATVYEIDRATRTVKRELATEGDSPRFLLLSPDQKTLWAANWNSDDVSEIDLNTGELVRLIPTVASPRGLYVTPDAGRLYVAGYDQGEIQRIDLATGTGTVIHKTGGAMWHMVGDDTGGLLYVDETATAEVYVVDLATDKVTKLANTDQRPNTMDLSPDGKVLYVSNRGKDNPDNNKEAGPEWGSVLAIDTTSGKVLDAIVGGNQCTGLDVSADGTLLAFSNFLDNSIRVYTIPAYAILIAGNGGRAAAHLEEIVKD